MTEAPQKNCIIHCRISTTKQIEGSGIEDQRMVGTSLARQKGWRVLKVFEFPHSGTKDNREDFDEILSWIDRSRVPVHFYVCRGIDRFTRAGVVEYIDMKSRLESLGVQVVDPYGLIQPKQNMLAHHGFEYPWSIYSPSETAEVMEALRAKRDVQNILTQLIGAEISLIKDGYHIGPPPDGFVNKRVFVAGKKRTVLEPNKMRAPFVTNLFRWRADGIDDTEIVHRLNAEGFRMPVRQRWNRNKDRVIGVVGGGPFTVRQLQRYVQRPIYAGIRLHKWTNYQPIRTKFGGLVSFDTFNAANRGKVYIAQNMKGDIRIVDDHSPNGKYRQRKLRDNPLYPFKIIRCPICRQRLFGSASTSKSGKSHPAYHCGGRRSGPRAHTFYRVRKSTLENSIFEFVERLEFNSKILGDLKRLLIAESNEQRAAFRQQTPKIKRHESDLNTQLAATVDAITKTNSDVVRMELTKKAENIKQQLEDLEWIVGQEVTVDELQISAFVRYAQFALEHPAEFLLSPITLDRLNILEELFGLFFEDVPSSDDFLIGTPKTPKLSLIFRLSADPATAGSLAVRYKEISWNTWIETVLKWNKVCGKYLDERQDAA